MNKIIKHSELENNPKLVERLFSLNNEKVKLRQMFYNVPEELKEEEIIILKDLNLGKIKETLMRKALVKYREEDLEIDFCLRVGTTLNSSGAINVYEIIYLPYSKSNYGDFKYTFIGLEEYRPIYLDDYLPEGIYSGIPYDTEDTDNSKYILINRINTNDKELETVLKDLVIELISEMKVFDKNFSVIGFKVVR